MTMTPEDCRGVSKQVRYEIDMLLATTADWLDFWRRRREAISARGEESAELTRERRQLLEVVAIHARSLYHFLYYESRGDKRNRLARDFFDPPEKWSQICPEAPAWLRTAANAASTQVAHIGTERPPFHDHHDWNPLALAGALAIALRAFVGSVNSDRLSSKKWPTDGIAELHVLASAIVSAGASPDLGESDYAARVMSGWMRHQSRLIELARC